LEQEATAAIAQGDHAAYDQLRDDQKKLGEFRPLVTHSFHEQSPFTFFHFQLLSAYKERHANSAPKIRLATMASHKARDGLSPRALVMWLVIMTPAVSAIQSQSQSQYIPAPS
jgi:hypothetical protein